MSFQIIAGKFTNQGFWHADRVVDDLRDWAAAVDVAGNLAPVCPVNVPDYLVYSTTTGRFWNEGHEIVFGADGRAA